MTLEELRARLAQIETELRGIHETAGDAALTEEQQTRWTELETERGTVNRDIEERQRRENLVRQLAANPANTEPGDSRPRGPEVMRQVTPFDGSEVRSLTRPEARDKALKTLESREHTAHLSDRQKAQMDAVLRKRDRNVSGEEIARRLLITENPHYRSAFQKLSANMQPVLTTEEQRAIMAWEEFRAMSIGSDGAGGYGVPVFIDPTIVLTAQGHPNDFFAISRVEVITNDEWKGVSSAGVSWSFDAEAAEVSDDSPTLVQPTVKAHMARGFIPYSIEVGMDYPGFAGEMSMLLSEGYSELLVNKLTLGTGTTEPFGIVTALDANTNVEVLPTTDGAFGAVDLYKVWEALPIRYRAQPRTNWMSSTNVQDTVRNFGASNNGANFTVNLTQENLPRLFERPYRVNDYMASFTATTGASNLLIVGDFNNYLIAQRAGMSVELVPHLFATANNLPSGQRGWFAHARVGADSINDLGFRLLQNQ